MVLKILFIVVFDQILEGSKPNFWLCFQEAKTMFQYLMYDIDTVEGFKSFERKETVLLIDYVFFTETDLRQIMESR